MNNISIATFKCGSKSCELYGLWQYDYGQILRIQDLGLPTAVEIHYQRRSDRCSNSRFIAGE